MKKGEIETKRNYTINVIYSGLTYLVWAIDWLGYSYMVDWRNQMMEWITNLEERYTWLRKK